MKQKDNIIDYWHKEWWCRTSSLYPYNQRISFRREDIEGIYNSLEKYFGLKHFEALHLNQCSYEDLDPIRCLLADSSGVSNLRIFEIINAIHYAERKIEELDKKMKATRNDPRQFMDLVFESEVNRILDQAGFHIQHNVVKGSQPLDGYLEFGGQGYIVECKKAYNFKFELIPRLWSLVLNMLSNIQRLNKGIGMYGYFTIDETSMKKSVHHLNQIIHQYFDQIKNNNTYFLRSKYDELKWHTFPYDKKDYLIKLNEEEWTFLFRLHPPDTITPGALNRYHSEIRFHYSIDHDDAHKKLFRIIESAKKQHGKNKELPLLLFLDFERTRSLYTPLFSSCDDIDSKRILGRINNSNRNVIICLFFRNFTSTYPKKELKVICDDKYESLKQKLESMNLNDGFELSWN